MKGAWQRQGQDRVLKAYFDRSQLGHPAAVMAVSGYLSSDEHWQLFEPSWHRILGAFGIEMFHMTEFECRLGAFRSWNNEARFSFIRQIIDLVGQHAFVGIGAAIVLADYDRLVREDRRLLGHPFAMCGLKAVAETLRWVDKRIEEANFDEAWATTEKGKCVPVEFVFEAGDEGHGELADQLRREQESGMFARRISSWSFQDKREIGALQAADFAAYETTKQLVRTIGAEERAMRKSLERFVTTTHYVAEYFDRRTMSEILDRMRRDATA